MKFTRMVARPRFGSLDQSIEEFARDVSKLETFLDTFTNPDLVGSQSLRRKIESDLLHLTVP